MRETEIKEILSRYHQKREQLEKKANLPLFVAFLGGTGVGKSSILNLLAQKKVSEVSVRRPTTSVPLVFMPEEINFSFQDFYSKNVKVIRYSSKEELDLQAIFFDLPDVDSHETKNHEIARELLKISDVVLVVLSPDNYGDHQVHQFIKEAFGENKRLVFILNKTEKLTQEEIETIKNKIFSFPHLEGKKIELIPFSTKLTPEKYRRILLDKLSKIEKEEKRIRKEELEKEKKNLREKIQKLKEELEEEQGKIQKELTQIEEFYHSQKDRLQDYLYGIFREKDFYKSLEKLLLSLRFPEPFSLFLVLRLIFFFFLEGLRKIKNFFFFFRWKKGKNQLEIEEKLKFESVFNKFYLYFKDHFPLSLIYNLDIQLRKKLGAQEVMGIGEWQKMLFSRLETFFQQLKFKLKKWEDKLGKRYFKFYLLDWTVSGLFLAVTFLYFFNLNFQTLISLSPLFFLMFEFFSYLFLMAAFWYGMRAALVRSFQRDLLSDFSQEVFSDWEELFKKKKEEYLSKKEKINSILEELLAEEKSL